MVTSLCFLKKKESLCIFFSPHIILGYCLCHWTGLWSSSHMCLLMTIREGLWLNAFTNLLLFLPSNHQIYPFFIVTQVRHPVFFLRVWVLELI